MNAPMKDWDALGSDWREQAVPAVDVEALRAEASRQGRRLRRTLVAETAMAVLALVLLGWIALHEDAAPIERWLFGAMALSMILSLGDLGAIAPFTAGVLATLD